MPAQVSQKDAINLRALNVRFSLKAACRFLPRLPASANASRPHSKLHSRSPFPEFCIILLQPGKKTHRGQSVQSVSVTSLSGRLAKPPGTFLPKIRPWLQHPRETRRHSLSCMPMQTRQNHQGRFSGFRAEITLPFGQKRAKRR